MSTASCIKRVRTSDKSVFERSLTPETAKAIPKNKELFLNYGDAYWAEGTFEDYLAEREARKNSEEANEGEPGRYNFNAEFTCSSGVGDSEEA